MTTTHKECGYPVVWMPYYLSLTPRSYALQALQQGGGTYGQIPIRALPLPGKNDITISTHAGKLCQEAAEGIFPYASQLGVFFEEFALFCTRLDAQLRMLRTIWTEFRPRVCLAESLSFGEYAVPLLACRQLVPSIGLPHYELYLPSPMEPELPATRYAFASAFSEDAFAEYTATGKIGSFAAVAVENSYPTQRHDRLLPRDSRVNILVVTVPPMFATPNLISCTEKKHTDSLRGLDDTPPDLQERVRVAFKTHPGTPHFWDYRHAGIGQERMLPRDSTMADALLTTDVLVSLNYISSPSCQAMREGIPVITCLTDDGLAHHYPHRSIIAAAGLMVKTPEEAWEHIRLLISNDGFRDKVIARQREFYETHVRPRRDDWSAWLKETIEEGA